MIHGKKLASRDKARWIKQALLQDTLKMSNSAPCEMAQSLDPEILPEIQRDPSSPSNPRKGVPDKWLVRVGPESKAMQARTYRLAACSRRHLYTQPTVAINAHDLEHSHPLHAHSTRTRTSRCARHADSHRANEATSLYWQAAYV